MKKSTIKKPGGRKKLPVQDKLRHPYQFKLNDKDNEQLEKMFKQSGFKNMAEFIRRRIIFSGQPSKMINPAKFLASIDWIGTELNKVGTNINQISKHANTMAMDNRYSPKTFEEFNRALLDYLKLKKELIKAYRAIIRKIN